MGDLRADLEKTYAAVLGALALKDRAAFFAHTQDAPPIPPEAWDYKLGNRCALDWILDQHKEKTPKDPTIREKFNTYRFADYKEKVVDLLMRVTRVSVETVAITQAMRAASR